jgi:hypothetical protein
VPHLHDFHLGYSHVHWGYPNGTGLVGSGPYPTDGCAGWYDQSCECYRVPPRCAAVPPAAQTAPSWPSDPWLSPPSLDPQWSRPLLPSPEAPDVVPP